MMTKEEKYEKARQWREANRAALRERYRARYWADPDRHRAYARKQTLTRYGLTEETKQVLLDAQGGACAICRRTDPGGRGDWHVDHDHAIGKHAVRGLLCADCNTTLGKFGDTLEAIRAWAASAVSYMERAEKTHARP